MGSIALVFGALFVFLPPDLVFALSVTALVAFLYFGIAAALTKYAHRTPDWLDTAPLWLIVLVYDPSSDDGDEPTDPTPDRRRHPPPET